MQIYTKQLSPNAQRARELAVRAANGPTSLAAFQTHLAANRDLSLHAGTQSSLQEGGQTIDSRIGAMNVQALGRGEVDISKDARRAIVDIDEALAFLDSPRGEIGAQILQQAAVSMLTQGNAIPPLALSLLR